MSEPEPEHHQNPIRFGILGCATIAHKFCRAISLLPSGTATISCISSRSLNKARQFATSARLLSSAKLLSPYDALLEDTSVDVVYVPLPTSQHVTWAVAAAAKGKHVLIEKPVALCMEELERILEACEKNGVLFMDGSMWQHHPRTAEMRRLIDDPNRIGQLRLDNSRVSVSVPEFGEWSKRKGVFTRDYSGHFAMVRSVRRYRKKLLSWTSFRNGDELVDESSKPVTRPEHYHHFSNNDNSRRLNNRTHKSPAIGGFMRFLFCCVGR